MLGYRDASDKHDEYYACTEVIPNTQFLESMIEILDTKLLKKLVDYTDWSPSNQFIKRAILRRSSRYPSPWKKRVRCSAFAGQKVLYFLKPLENSELFNIKHRPYWFSTVQMSVATMEQMQARIPGKLTTNM